MILVCVVRLTVNTMRLSQNWSRIVEASNIFEKLVTAGNPVGEIIGIDSSMVSVRGLQPTNVHATVRFDDDTRGYVHQVPEDHVVVMKLDPSPLHIGAVCVIEARDIMV